MPVPTTEMVTPLRASSASKVSPRVRDGVGVTALPRTMPVIDAPADADDGPTDDSASLPPHELTMSPTTASTAVPAAERIRCIQFLQVGNGAGQVGNPHTRQSTFERVGFGPEFAGRAMLAPPSRQPG